MKKQEDTGNKQRITICLEKKQATVLDDVCQSIGCSRSWLMAQLVENADFETLLKTRNGER